MSAKVLYVLGTRGIPARHGGFETFAEKLCLFLVANGWTVYIYCQESGEQQIRYSEWNGVHRIHVSVKGDGALSTVVFDLKVALHAMSKNGLMLTLGYNTALFNVFQRFSRQLNIINMDGIEWKRDKWGIVAKTWFWLNERLGCWFGNHLVADHPKIKEHLSTRVSFEKITMIPYGGDQVLDADSSLLNQFGLTPHNYSIIIARPEPENSFLEMVTAFSKKKRNHKLVVLGNFKPSENSFHKSVIDAASDEVIFTGAIYEPAVVQSLRFYSRIYLHGHRVGGTNPSLVEAMGAGCAVLAHDNHFNRWVVDKGGVFFESVDTCSSLLDDLLHNDEMILLLKTNSRLRFNEYFTWSNILKQYEDLFLDYIKK